VASPHLSVRRARTTSTPNDTTSRPPRRVGRLRAAVLLTAAASIGLTLLPGAASAVPGPAVTRAATPQEATRLAADANHDLEVVTEEVHEAQVTLEEQQAAAAAAGDAVLAAEAQLQALAGQMRQVARSAFTGENLSRFNALMTSGSADEFLAQVNTLDAIAGHTDEVLAQVNAAAVAAAEAKAQADAAATAAQRTLDDVTARQADLQGRIADYRAQFAALTAAQQAEVNEVHAGPVLEAPPARSVKAPSGAAQDAVDTALAQLGDPYVWGAGGPSAFDCSGLTQFALAAAGVKLPHSSRVQSTMGTAVPRAQLQPGDLVFFYSPVSHVGMYIGNGKMVHAATFGSPVQVASVDMKGYVGARRLL
jgi:cell wall-associated NlpC family hydrolase